MFAFLLIVQSLVAISLVGVILMQRSEGGGLGVGGSSSGFMTARGAADFLTRSTSILGGIFIVLSIAIWISLILVTGQLLFGITMLAAGLAFVPADALRAVAGRHRSAAQSPLRT